MRILLADDEPRVRSAIRLLIDQHYEGNVVEEVSSTQELAEHIGNYCPDLLLLDWELLGAIPEELLTSIHTRCPDIFTIVLDSESQTRQSALEAGANEFVGKNEPPESLLAAIKSSRNSNKK